MVCWPGEGSRKTRAVERIVEQESPASLLELATPDGEPVDCGGFAKRGVAQLAERRSPKPEVASSIPAAPASRTLDRKGDSAGEQCRSSRRASAGDLYRECFA